MSKSNLSAGRPSGRTAAHVQKLMTDIDEEKRLNVIMPASEYYALKSFALDQRKTVSELVRAALKKLMQP